MITVMDDLPSGVLGVAATGELTSADYKNVLVPAIDAALAGGGKLRLLYRLGPGFTGIEAGAMWQDTKFGMEHLRSFERIALVTDVDWIANATRAFAWMMPGEVKVFDADGTQAAVEWLTA